MAKHGSRRRGYRYLPINKGFDLLTTAPGVVIASNMDTTMDEDTFAISSEQTWNLEAHTAGEGPIVVGLAHSDYTAAEIEEALEAVASWDAGDRIAQERRRRKVRQVGIFNGQATTEVLNDGRPVKTKLGFVINSGETLKVWAWSKDSSNLTTGTILGTQGGLSCRKM